MSNINALTELAKFVAKSPHASDSAIVRRRAMDSLKESVNPTPMHQKVTDLLGTVMALSARTRRVLQPKVEIDLDVFAPDNNRAVVMIMGPMTD